MLFRLPLEALVLLIPTLMFALSFHEFAHAWMAAKCGDTTAARMGRLSLNPMAHLDLALIHIRRCRRYAVCRSRGSPYH
mgnify:CR=1 FL=1